jgi:hypothetical protein
VTPRRSDPGLVAFVAVCAAAYLALFPLAHLSRWWLAAGGAQ